MEGSDSNIILTLSVATWVWMPLLSSTKKIFRKLMLEAKAKPFIENLQSPMVILKFFFWDTWEILENTAIIRWYMLETSLGRVFVCYSKMTGDNSNSKSQSTMMTYKNILKTINHNTWWLYLYLVLLFFRKNIL